MRDNIILKTDSYKLSHPRMLPLGTTRTFSHLEARKGGLHDQLCWCGLQPILKKIEGPVVSNEDIEEAESLCEWHFSGGVPLAREGWKRIINKHGGMLPVCIEAVPEGMVIPTGNMLLSVENTDPDPSLAFLPGHLESLIMKVWYPSTIASRDWHIKQEFVKALVASGCDAAYADFMLQDFGYRGVSSEESARIGGGAHLVNFRGTDTIEGMRHVMFFYGARMPGFSVAASQHEIATALGRTGEFTQQRHVLAAYQNQIVSLVADSYDYEQFVIKMCDEKSLVDQLKVRLVIRPDSLTRNLKSPKEVVLWTLQTIDARLGSTKTPTGHKVLPYKVLYGDGMEHAEIIDILWAVVRAGFAASNLVFGEGGGMLQKVHRDMYRFAYKSSAQERDGKWFDVAKDPIDQSKASKAGRLRLIKDQTGFRTVPYNQPTMYELISRPVFNNGLILHQDLFDTVQDRAKEAMKSVMELHAA